MSESLLRQNVEAAVEELNEKRTRWGTDTRFHAEVGIHSQGPAIDIWKDGEAVFKDAYPFFKAAQDAGYTVSNCKVFEEFGLDKGPHTRLFLHEASDRHDVGGPTEEELEYALESKDRARVEGFLAGVFFAGVVEGIDDGIEPEDIAVAPFAGAKEVHAKPDELQSIVHDGQQYVFGVEDHNWFDSFGTSSFDQLDPDLQDAILAALNE